ncbi:MAG: DUF131 domain-containing protein [Candidatus Bathyarchaeia archaeon]
MFDQSFLFALGFILIFSGFAVALLAILLLFFKGINARGKTRGGAMVMIGPIPIVFGTDKETVKTLLTLAIVLMILVMILTFFSRIF